jgi:hypothetical protein
LHGSNTLGRKEKARWPRAGFLAAETGATAVLVPEAVRNV